MPGQVAALSQLRLDQLLLALPGQFRWKQVHHPVENQVPSLLLLALVLRAPVVM